MCKLSLIQVWLLAVCCLAGLIMSCGNENPETEENDQQEEWNIYDELDVSMIDAWHFYHAWLADCANDRQVGYKDTAHKVLTDTARNRINRAVLDPAIVAAFPGEELVWGPVLAVDDVGDKDYVAENLLYCLKHTLPNSTDVIYSIGIAGTDAVSTFDWLSEDLAVQDSVSWGPGGHISKAAYKGFQKLIGFQDNGVDLLTFLKNNIPSNQRMWVTVTGHSLGGALTQVLASHLEKELRAIAPGMGVDAYVFAGPTAGNQEFADSLVKQLYVYSAFNNTRDAVPHAWNTDTLKQVCNLYTGLNICDKTINNSLLVDGLVTYLVDISKSMRYTAPAGAVTYFTGVPYQPTGSSGCTDLEKAIHKAWKDSDTGDVYENLNAISSQCGGSSTIDSLQFKQFAYFLTEMGMQHTEAYYKYFLSPFPAVEANLKQYVAGESGTDIEWDSADALGSILGKADAYLQKNNITTCNCQ